MRSSKKQARKSRRQGPRSAARAAARFAVMEAQASRTAAAGCALGDMPLSGGFTGHRNVRGVASGEGSTEAAEIGQVIRHDGGCASCLGAVPGANEQMRWQEGG